MAAHDHNDLVRTYGYCSICLAAPHVEAERKRRDPNHVVDTRHVAHDGAYLPCTCALGRCARRGHRPQRADCGHTGIFGHSGGRSHCAAPSCTPDGD